MLEAKFVGIKVEYSFVLYSHKLVQRYVELWFLVFTIVAKKLIFQLH
jgi:hypothetical protein